jgi:hypothetical protein
MRRIARATRLPSPLRGGAGGGVAQRYSLSSAQPLTQTLSPQGGEGFLAPSSETFR